MMMNATAGPYTMCVHSDKPNLKCQVKAASECPTIMVTARTREKIRGITRTKKDCIPAYRIIPVKNTMGEYSRRTYPMADRSLGEDWPVQYPSDWPRRVTTPSRRIKNERPTMQGHRSLS